MKRPALFLAAALALAIAPASAMGNSQDTQTTPQVNDQTRETYRAYIAQLKELSKQYGAITSEIKQVIKEEGIPTWDESTGSIQMTRDVNFSSTASAAAKDASVSEGDKEVKIVVEAPGLKKDSIRVEIENERLVRVRATKKALGSAGEQPFESAYTLETPVQDKNASARYEDGVLTVTLQKVSKKIVPVTVR